MGSNLSHFQYDDLPVENVSWDKIQTFLKKLNEKTGQKYRLPTVAEWYFAARGGNRSRGYKYSGSNDANEVAWFDKNSNERTHPVGQKLPNELGIYDMHGNVEEWVNDWSGKMSKGIYTNPQGPSSGKYRLICGGNYYYWKSTLLLSMAKLHSSKEPQSRSEALGFRLALDAE
jgi:formylglycine-generating enzyme required for sulfatase activity